MGTEKKTERLRLIIDETGIKQKKIAQIAGVSPSCVSQVVNGKARSARIEQIIDEIGEKYLARK